MDAETIRDMAANLATAAANLFEQSEQLANATTKLAETQAQGGRVTHFYRCLRFLCLRVSSAFTLSGASPRRCIRH